MAKLSTETQAGKILVLIGIILGAVGLAGLFMAGSVLFFFIPTGLLYVVAAVVVIGLGLQFIAYRRATEGRVHEAGIVALVAAFVPPLNIIALIAGILFLVSPEAKKGK